jgi:lipopolysaccharide transport system ATP-binding protein
LSRIVEPTTGRVRIRGRVASLLEVGTGFHPELTGRENIFLNGAILGMTRSEIKKKFDEIVDFAEIEKFLDTPVKRYSSGMYVRLAFAVAAHLEPEILLVDEVLAVGDAQFQAKCLDKMRSMAHKNRTVLFVSHNMGIIKNFCDRAILLNDGIIRFHGETGVVLESYLSLCNASSINLNKFVKVNHDINNEWFVPEKIELLCNGSSTSIYEMGSSLQVIISYVQKKASKFLKLGIHINDSSGNLICVLSPNQQSPNFVSTLKLSGTISCTIPSLNLISGTYSISIHYEIPGTTKMAYCIENAASFQVVESDVYGTGIIPAKIHGIIYLLADWSF